MIHWPTATAASQRVPHCAQALQHKCSRWLAVWCKRAGEAAELAAGAEATACLLAAGAEATLWLLALLFRFLLDICCAAADCFFSGSDKPFPVADC